MTMMTFWEGRPTLREAWVWLFGMVYLAEGDLRVGLLILSVWVIWIADVEAHRRKR